MRTEIKIVRSVLGLKIACKIAPAAGQTSGQHVTVVMQGELATQVLEDCNSELTQYCAEVYAGRGSVARVLLCVRGQALGIVRARALRRCRPPRARAIGAISCAELETHCTGVEVGDGRVTQSEPLAGTSKACPLASMNVETRFHEALGENRGYRFENGLLFLLDAQGASVMRLWRRNCWRRQTGHSRSSRISPQIAQ